MKQKLIQEIKTEIIEEKIEQARMLLIELERDKRESPFEKARRFLFIQESLARMKK